MSVVDPRHLANWSPSSMGKVTAYRSERLLVGINAFEPGQEHAQHVHEGSDKLYLVLEGRGTFTLAGRDHALIEGQGLVAPSGVEHGVVNDGPHRLLVLVAMAPPPAG